MKRYLGLICLLYSLIILYVWLSDLLKNFLAPNLQIYIKISLFILIIMFLVLIFNNKIEYKFKISDLILLLPLLMLIVAGDGRLTINFANNRTMNYSVQNKTNDNTSSDKKEETNQQETKEKKEITKIDIDVKDASYAELANYLSFGPKAQSYINQTIRVKGFALLDDSVIPSGYFAIGKYNISCCAADAEFVGFYVKKENYNISNNSWYEIEGILEKVKGLDGSNAVAISIVNLKEIDFKKEEQYVYPCYAYDNGSCAEVSKYDLSY